jgi:hypothetical protein
MYLSERVRDQLYRIALLRPHGPIHAFVFARSGAWATRTVREAVSALYDIPGHVSAMQDLRSFDDLVAQGTSADEDSRIFEVAWRGTTVTAWVERPLFLTEDPTLAVEWVHLQMHLADEKAYAAMRRAAKD